MIIRLLQIIALYVPGAKTVRVWLHRRRGVTIGRDVFIGTDVLLETSRPDLIAIDDEAVISVRATVVAHFRGKSEAERRRGAGPTVRIGRQAFIGPGAVILDGVTIGEGAVVTAGSVVTHSVPPRTVVQGNPARAVARAGRPLVESTTYAEFVRGLEPLRPAVRSRA